MTRTEPFDQQVLPDLRGFNELKVYFFFSVKKKKKSKDFIKGIAIIIKINFFLITLV